MVLLAWFSCRRCQLIRDRLVLFKHDARQSVLLTPKFQCESEIVVLYPKAKRVMCSVVRLKLLPPPWKCLLSQVCEIGCDGAQLCNGCFQP